MVGPKSGIFRPGLDPRAERSRAAALAAARAVLLEEGWDAVSQMRVAQRAGIGRTTVYRHWPDRADLLLDVIKAEARSLPAQATGDLRADLLNEVHRFTRLSEQPGWTRVIGALVHHASSEPEIRAVLDQVNRINLSPLRDLVAEAVRSGELRADTRPDQAVAHLIGPLMYWFLIAAAATPEGFAESLVDQFLGAHLKQKPSARAGHGQRTR